MASSTGLLALVGLGALALVATSKKSVAAVNPNAPTSLPLGTGKYDANLPAILELTVDQELANDSDPNSLLTFANSLAPSTPDGGQTYPNAAATLRARAAQLQQPNPPAAPAAPTTPPPATPVVSPPVVVSPAQPVPPAQPAPVASGDGSTTIAPVTVVGTPVTASTPSGDPANGVTQVTWDASTMTPPDVSSIAIPASYQATSDETRDVQGAINAWAQAVSYQDNDANGNPLIPLTIDGSYGPDDQKAVAAFQNWVNITQDPLPANVLTVDGLAGSKNAEGGGTTQSWLASYLPAGGSFATDGNY